ncbi:MAG: hypothetical protein Fur0041_13760 [Bacteroidia bacterium]
MQDRGEQFRGYIPFEGEHDIIALHLIVKIININHHKMVGFSRLVKANIEGFLKKQKVKAGIPDLF